VDLSIEAIFPTFPPLEVLGDQLLQRDVVQMVIQTPPGRDVADDEDSCSVPSRRQIIEKTSDASDRLAPALAAREGFVEVRGSIPSVGLGPSSIAFAVVALSKPPVEKDRHPTEPEGNLSGLRGTAKVGTEHRRDPVVSPSPSQLSGELATTLTQAAVPPSRGDAQFVVLTEGMGLKDDRDRHGPTLRGSPNAPMGSRENVHPKHSHPMEPRARYRRFRVRAGDVNGHSRQVSGDDDRPRGVGRFRSTEGRERFEAAYDLALRSWPLRSSAVEVRTSFGTTRINACGATTGSPVVLLAGALMTSVSWSPNVAVLGAAHPVFAVDAVGDAGLSMHDRPVRTRTKLASWFDELLKGLDIERAHVIGLSNGACTAMNQALRAPSRLGSVAAIEPPGLIVRPSPRLLGEMVRGAVLRTDRALDRLARFLGNGSLPPDPLYAVLRSVFVDFRPAGFVPRRLTDEQLRSINTPVLLIFGERTPIGDVQKAVARAHRHMPVVRTEIVPGCAHTPTIEQPDLTNRSLLAFIDGVDKGIAP
jgi:pimeloyl-ACP methyl ester carboxylesterase